MTKFILMVGLLALVISCGQQEVPQEGEPGTIGSRFELKDIRTFDKKEVSSIKAACTGLALKERALSSQYAGKGVVFDFSSQKLDCGKTVPKTYKTGAKVEFQNGKMFFEKMASNALIFNDIILRNDGPLKDFCDKAEAGALSKRYISNGKMVSIVYGVGRGNWLKIAVETAFSYDENGKYVSQSTDEFIINNDSGKYKGFVFKRTAKSSAGCTGEDVTMLETILDKVH